MPKDRSPGDLLVRAGALIFLVGVVAVLLILVPYLAGGSSNSSTTMDLLALLLPLGFGIALLGLLRGARSHD